jgi:hypothetical protein
MADLAFETLVMKVMIHCEHIVASKYRLSASVTNHIVIIVIDATTTTVDAVMMRIMVITTAAITLRRQTSVGKA